MHRRTTTGVCSIDLSLAENLERSLILALVLFFVFSRTQPRSDISTPLSDTLFSRGLCTQSAVATHFLIIRPRDFKPINHIYVCRKRAAARRLCLSILFLRGEICQQQQLAHVAIISCEAARIIAIHEKSV